MVSILYHAEKAALEAFERLEDPSIVENCDIFLRARPMLIADESAHIRDMEEIVRLFGGEGIPPAPAGFDEIWSLEVAQRRLKFPLRAHVAALFTLVTESLGYAYLYHLANVTASTNSKVADLLAANVRDEERHIRVSMHVLRRALGPEASYRGFDLALHLFAFLLMSRRAARTMFTSLRAVGFDPYVVGASSLQFTCLLIVDVVGARFGVKHRRRIEKLLDALLSPQMIRVFQAGCYLPEPPFVWWVLRRLSRITGGVPLQPSAAQ